MFANSSLYQEDLDNILSSEIPWQELQGKSLLLTGASGLIGTVLVDALMKWNQQVEQGITIYAVGRSEQHNKERFAEYLGNPYFKFIAWDVNEPAAFVVRADYVIHAASNTHPKAYATDPIGSIMTNLLGLRNVLDFAHQSQAKRVMFMSSVEIYGKAYREEDVFTEDYCGYIDCNTLRAGYPEGKRAGEALCQAYIEKYGMDIVIPRLSRVFGPTMKDSDSKAMAQFIRNAVKGEPIILKSAGRQRFSYCYAADAVSGLITVLLNGQCGEAYNIGQMDKVLSLREIAEVLGELAGNGVMIELPEQMEVKGYSTAVNAILDTEKIKRLLWESKTDIISALQRTVEILKE